MKTFPREIVISGSHGAGLVTSWDSYASPIRDVLYDIIESDALIGACISGIPWRDAVDALIADGFDSEIVYGLYEAGWDSAIVVSVDGPYFVEEYDGKEYAVERAKIRWRE